MNRQLSIDVAGEVDVNGHLRAIESQLASIGVEQRLFDSVLAQDALPAGPELDYYRSKGAEPVDCDLDGLRDQGYRVMLASMQGPQQRSQGRDFKGTLRHDSRNLALAVMRFYKTRRTE